MNTRYRQSGMSLLEVLFAIVIFAFGLLGAAQLQATGLLNNKRAYEHSQATLQAYNLADRMRANTLSIDNYLTSYMTLKEAKQQSVCKSTTSCTPGNMAENDLFEWKTTLAADLRDATGIITFNGGIYTISVTWDDNGDGSTNDKDPSFQVSFQL